MNLVELSKMVPYIANQDEKSVLIHPYPSIELALPGRHSEDTEPVGGDFVVRVTDQKLKWKNHEFTHTDIFQIVQRGRDEYGDQFNMIMTDYYLVVKGESPPLWDTKWFFNATTFLRAVQCLALAEHRRYFKHEKKFGGRYLPFRFAAGIAEGLWDASDAAGLQKRGRPGVEMLEKFAGQAQLTRRLMNG